ncbi:MAG: DUF1559 family PulG-like putative transporter [Planctomycetales bacterium]
MYRGVDLDLSRWTLDVPLRDNKVISTRRFGSAHSGGCFFLMCDGAVHRVSYSVDAKNKFTVSAKTVRTAYLDADGGENGLRLKIRIVISQTKRSSFSSHPENHRHPHRMASAGR